MDYDIIVVGAGPSGCIFSKYISGKKVLLIDGQSKIHKKPCGGLISPDAQDWLAYFDFTLPEDVMSSPQIFSVRVMDLQSKTVRFFRRCYLNTDRYRFDRYLFSLVPDSVDKISGRVEKIAETDGGFEVTVNTDGIKKQYTSSNIVGADGANSIVRATFFGRKGMKQYTAIQQWFKVGGHQNPFYSCVFDKETSDSCSWVMFKGEYLIFGGCFETHNCREMFEKQKKRVEELLGYGFGAAEETEACLVCSPRRMSDFKPGSKNVFLIGEAAGFISASSFEGISFALKSGYILACSFEKKDVIGSYKRAVFPIELKLILKSVKRAVICSKAMRNVILKAGIGSIKLKGHS